MEIEHGTWLTELKNLEWTNVLDITYVMSVSRF